MYHRELNAAVCVGMLFVLGCGRGSVSPQHVQQRPNEDVQTVRLHFEGFTKSKSGATWMAWPNKVKEALVGLQAVGELRMELERDEFIVTYDASRATVDELIATCEKTGFPAKVVHDTPSTEIPSFFRDALARAKEERKPVVLDFTASWCQPCQKMLRETFPNPLVADLLDERCVLIKVDTDEHPGLAQKYNVVGLPDIRFLNPDGEELQRQRDFQDAETFAATLTTFLKQVAKSEQADELIDISESEQNLRDIFNHDSQYVRLLLILSPTWGPCQNGARVAQEQILDMLPNDQLRLYVVWTPVLREDNRAAAVEAMSFVSGERVTHFWDGDKSLGLAFGRTVDLPRDRTLGWDVYFVFDRKVRWDQPQPPVPTEWMHQLGTDERLLDGLKLHESVTALLNRDGS